MALLRVLLLVGLLAAHMTRSLGGGEKEGEEEGRELEEEELEEEELDDYIVEYPDASPRPVVAVDMPRFVVTLQDQNLLCFGIEGYELFTYNLLTTEQFSLSTFVNISQMENGEWERGHTDIGVIVNIKDKRVRAGSRLLKAVIDGTSKKAKLAGFGEVDMHNGAITISVEGSHSSIESGEAVFEEFRLVLDQPKVDVHAISDGRFFNFFVRDGSGLGEVPSHGVIGQFLSSQIRIDTANWQLILPNRDPIPVKQGTVWESITEREFQGKPCWYPTDNGNVLEGMPYDYIVEHILSTKYKFSQFLV